MDENKTVELEEMNIILRIPKEAIKLEVNALLLDEEGEVVKVGQSFSASRIREMRNAFLDNVEYGDDYDGYFVLTDEARAELEREEMHADKA